jgi:hydroxymethylpyrimidine pyrophosphatase-like HAD family hydrolase
MRYLALACDFDETLVRGSELRPETVSALERLRASGRKVILVTGREFEDLLSVCPSIDLFDRVVAENGALLYWPESKKEKVLADPPPPALISALSERSIPFSQGRVVLSTGRPYDTALLQAISDLGLEHQIIFNKGSVMLLPSGVNKATGLKAALRDLKLAPHNVVGIGDAENDHAFLSLCECAVAVANALPTVQQRADFVTAAENGAGVIELIEEVVATDLAAGEPLLTRHHILIGTRNGEEVRIPPYSKNLLFAGSSGGGKSTLATGFLEKLVEAQYQFCVVDPEGDYESFEGAVVLGNNERAPNAEEVLKVLEDPEDNLVINLIGVDLADRPAYLLALLPRLQEMRAQTGRPHWILLDETHHVLPSTWDPATLTFPPSIDRMIFVTVEPEQVHSIALQTVETVITVGDKPWETLEQFCQTVGAPAPSKAARKLKPGEALFWSRKTRGEPFVFAAAPNRTQRRRHQRKYAEGELPEERSFYFKGPNGSLNLRAQNLILFTQLGEGVDDETWVHHLRQGDYSRWFRERIKDEGLAEDAASVESTPELSPAESRRMIKQMIEKRYTLPE